MFFCEKCNFATSENSCPLCGKKKLRDVKDEDFCFYSKMSVYDFEMFGFTLKENGIEAVGVPYYPYGVSRANAGRAGARKVYVRYGDWEKAGEIFETIFGASE